MFNKIVFIFGLCGIAINCYCETPSVSCVDLNRNITGQGVKMKVVDVRGAVDFEKSHIPGAINAPYDSIEKAGLPREGNLVLYCGNNQCPWSKLGARTLENAGYKNVRVLDGGITNWTAEGFALESAAGLEKKSALVAVPGITPAQLRKQLGDKAVGIIDTRPEKEFVIAHLPGAKNIPFEGFASAIPTLSKDIEWMLCDKQQENAKAAARQMIAKGFKAKELSGGILVWAAKKYPLETGPSK